MRRPVRFLPLFCALLLCGLPAGTGRAGDSTLQADQPIGSVEERRVLVSIQEKLAGIREKENLLRLKELELKTLSGEVDKKLEAWQKLREELAEQQKRQKEEDAKRVRELSKIYEKMDPEKAASFLVTLEEELAVRILAGMKNKAAGKVLGNLGRTNGAKLSKAYSALRRE